ncbi:MAG: hypothetical protein FK733_03995 [Asgard group archaeon]|nr:hypothetical protein [Asgard group archaeon]
MVLENLATNSISPIGSILIGPVVELPGPKWIPFLFRILPPFAINWLKPVMRRGIRTKLVDAEKEPEQVEDYTNALNAADGSKLREWTLKNINKYNSWRILSKIDNRIILVGTSTDKTHSSETAVEISQALSNSTLVRLESNKAAHDLAFVEIAFKFIEELSNKGPKITENTIPVK